jgi:hypothetical protein
MRSLAYFALAILVVGAAWLGQPSNAADAAAPAEFRLPFVGRAYWNTYSFHSPSVEARDAQRKPPAAGEWDGTVLAADEGTVIYSQLQTNNPPHPVPDPCPGRLFNFGNVIVIEHSVGGTRYESVYAHLSVRQASVGNHVTKGQQIGIYGDTGCTTGAHLHFEVRMGGTAGSPFSAHTFINVDNLPGVISVGTTDCFAGCTGEAVGPPVSAPSPPVDVYLIVDLSGSFSDDLPVFKAQAPAIISTLRASNPNTRFGLGKFEDYPIFPFGDPGCGDMAYQRLVDLTLDTGPVLSTIAGLFTRCGFDGPQSQLPALFQAATGAGQDLSGAGFPGASIAAGQQANFRHGATKLILLWTDASFHLPGDSGAIPYPGPSITQTVGALLAVDPAKVIGISSGPDAVPDLSTIAQGTNALAPAGGVDCNGDGTIDIPAGEPLVCSIASSGEGIGDAIVSLVRAAIPPVAAAIAKDPPLANLWLCQPAATCGVPEEGVGERDFNIDLNSPITSLDPKCTGFPNFQDPATCPTQTIGSFEFEVRYDAKFVTVQVDPGSLLQRADAQCATTPGQGFIQFRCNLKGKPTDAPVGPGTLAIVRVRPTADVYSMLIPNQDNGIATQLINQGCQLSDLQGHPIELGGPGAPPDLCGDAAVTIRYLEGDMNADCLVNVQDQQQIAFRWGSRDGNLLYNSRFDLEPAAPKKGDGDIDAKDLQVVFGRHDSTCADPHPPQPPVDPKAAVVPPGA